MQQFYLKIFLLIFKGIIFFILEIISSLMEKSPPVQSKHKGSSFNINFFFELRSPKNVVSVFSFKKSSSFFNLSKL